MDPSSNFPKPILCHGLLVVALLATAGCQERAAELLGNPPHASHDHDHGPSDHSHPHSHDSGDEPHPDDPAPARDLSTVVSELEAAVAKISLAFTAGNPQAAHDPLHDFEHRLDDLSRIAAESSAANEVRDRVEEAVTRLRAAAERLSASIHGEAGGASYEDVRESVQDAIDELRKSAAPKN